MIQAERKWHGRSRREGIDSSRRSGRLPRQGDPVESNIVGMGDECEWADDRERLVVVNGSMRDSSVSDSVWERFIEENMAPRVEVRY